MKRAIMLACAGVAFAAPAASAGDADKGDKGKSDIAKACAELKKADKAAFRATYGKQAMRSCKKGEKPDAEETTPAEFKNAAKECRAERDADPEAFQETFGTNGNGKNAFGKCVSTKVQEDDEEEEAPTS